MAVKAKAEITISRIIDIDKVTRYYLLQSSTATAPSKPTSNPPDGNWKTTEPSYTSGSTNTLYFVDLTVMTNGSFSYSAVSKSSSYEAAKEAWNKANNAQNTANNAAKTATNYLKGSEDGLVVGNMTDEILGSNVLIDPDSVNIRDGDTILAKYSEKKIELGLNSADAVIEMCGGVGLITSQVVEESEFSTGITKALSIESDYIKMDKARTIELDTNTLYGTNADNEEEQSSSYITLNSGKASSGLHDSTFIMGGLISGGDLGAFIHGNIGELDGAVLTTRVDGINKSTDITISHSSTDAIVDYDGMTIESCDVVRFQSNINNEYCIGVGVGGGGVNRGIHDTWEDHWMLYCDANDMYFQAPKTSKIKPYYRAGDSIQLYYQGAGFVTSDGKCVVFTLPINKPIDASNVVASSVSGFIGRSNGKYTHGSTSSTYVKPASYEAAINGNAVRVSMNFKNNTNVTNNAAIGVTWSGKITFS